MFLIKTAQTPRPNSCTKRIRPVRPVRPVRPAPPTALQRPSWRPTESKKSQMSSMDVARVAIAAIAKGDARAVFEAVASTQMPPKMACALGQQAWRSDVATGKIGKFLSENGLLSAVYMGIAKAQEVAGTLSQGDNATTWIANLAVTLDDPRVVDVIVDWDPTFKMGPLSEKASVDTTAGFFIECGAPKCAARIMERKNDLVMAPKNGFLRHHAEDRALHNAKRILERGVCDGDGLTIAALNDVINDDGRVQVLDLADVVMTIGLSLVGKSEIVAHVGPGQDASEVILHVRRLADRSARGDGLGCVARAGDPVGSNLINGLLKATNHLRPKGVSPFVLVDGV